MRSASPAGARTGGPGQQLFGGQAAIVGPARDVLAQPIDQILKLGDVHRPDIRLAKPVIKHCLRAGNRIRAVIRAKPRQHGRNGRENSRPDPLAPGYSRDL